MYKVFDVGSDKFCNHTFNPSYKINHPPQLCISIPRGFVELCRALPHHQKATESDFQSECFMSKIIQIFLFF